MTAIVTVRFGPTQEFALRVDATIAHADASRWLEDEFVRLGAEPVRASGKILVADRLLSIASAAGPRAFEDDPGWSARFAECAVGAVGRDRLTIDCETMRVRS
jgi:hypothetical protein